MKKKVISMFIALSLCVNLFVPTAQAGGRKNFSNRIKGKICGEIIYTQEETDNAIEWLEYSKHIGEIWIENEILNTDNDEKRKLLYEALDTSKAFDVEDLFDIHDDYSSTLSFPLPYCDIEIDGIRVKTDENGEYLIDDFLYNGNDELEKNVYYQGNLFYSENIDISTDIVNDMIEISDVLSMSGEQVTEAADVMGETMAHAQDSYYKPSYFGYKTSDFGTYNTSAKPNRYQNFLAVKKNGISYNMTFVTPTGIVACNKADGSLNSANSFPVNASDCAVSIGLGVLAANNIVLLAFWYNSVNCVIESAQHMLGESTNVYCNGKNKSGKYNCSWFNGIGCSEVCHIHSGNTTYK